MTAEGSYLDRKGPASWIFSTDHKRIGILYMVSILSFFLVGVSLGFLMRLEMLAPGGKLFKAETYNALFTVHGVIMIFLFVIPGLPSMFGNFFLPIMIGARDVAFPRLNLLSWWVYMTGAVLALTSLFTGGGAPDTGWTFYVPYSIRTHTNVTLAVFAAFILGFSSILTGLNFITTIHRMRAPGMGWFRMPLFPWSLYATAWIQVLATPILAITLVLVMLERLAGIGIFDPAKGGDPILFEHLFWIYSHPAVYIMILPAMGIISEIIPTFSQKSIFGYKAIAYSGLAIAFVGYLVWGHHMFTSGMSDTARWSSRSSPSSWPSPAASRCSTGSPRSTRDPSTSRRRCCTPCRFIFLFSIGGLTGLMQGALATNLHLHGTYFIVGHFHYVMFGSTGFAMFGALMYWFPKMTGRMYNQRRAVAAWAHHVRRIQSPLFFDAHPGHGGDAPAVLRLPAALSDPAHHRHGGILDPGGGDLFHVLEPPEGSPLQGNGPRPIPGAA